MKKSITMTAILGSLLVIACGTTDIAVDNGDAELRVVHASPDAPPVDIYVAGVDEPVILAGVDEPVIANLAYGEATHFLPLAAGDYEVLIRPAGADASSEPVLSTFITLADGDRVSAIAAGLLGSDDASAQFRLVTFIDDFQPPSPGFATVRVVHAGADAPAVGLDVGADGSVEITDIERFTSVGGVQLPAGQLLRIGVVAGFPPTEVTTFTLPELSDGSELLVIATGLLSASPTDSDGFSLLAVTPTATGRIIQDPLVFALHASPDAPAVDLFTPDTVLLAADLSFGQLSDPIRVAAGPQTIDFWPAGIEHGAAPAATASTNLAPGTDYLLVATGFLAPGAGEAPFQLIAVADEFDREDAINARIRIVHASPDAPSVDVGPLGVHGGLGALLVEDLAFSLSTLGKGVSVAPQPINIGVADSQSGAVAASFAIEPDAGDRVFVVAAGALTPNRGEPFRLIAVVTNELPWVAITIPAL